MKRTIRLLTVGALTFSGIALADGAALFSKNCMTCHGKDGKGETDIGEAFKITNLTDPAVQTRLTDELITKQVNEGSKDKVTGTDRMTSFKGKLTDAEIKELVAYVRTLKAPSAAKK